MTMTRSESLEDDWSLWDDAADELPPMPSRTPLLVDRLPSSSLRPVSSCYFSIVSSRSERPPLRSEDVLYPDILSHVLSYLDDSSWKAFSETARAPNKHVHEFLQRRLRSESDLERYDRVKAQTLKREYQDRSLPFGCVGAYRETRRRAQKLAIFARQALVRETFDNLPDEERARLVSEWLDACTSDEDLERVQELSQQVDVHAWYQGECALHMACFAGARGIVEFLCAHEACDVNRADDNGWTALHFAAGANAVEVTKVLLRFGADGNKEASNGYTPGQWALRLQNSEVAELLKPPSSQPFTMIASRFWAMLPRYHAEETV